MLRVNGWILAALLVSWVGIVPALENDTALVGTRWTLGGAADAAFSTGSAPTLTFGEGGRVSGNDGCNAFQANFKAAGHSIQFGQVLAGTLAACSEDVEARARAFRESLSSAVGFERNEAILRLFDTQGNVVGQFTKDLASPTGNEWEVLFYNNGKQAMVSVAIGSRITARFGDDGRVSGTGGCNRYAASYSTAGSAIHVAPPQVTRRTCETPQKIMEQEALFLAAMQSVAKFEMRGDRLELRTAAGALAVHLKRVIQ